MKKIIKSIVCSALSLSMLCPFIQPALIFAQEEEEEVVEVEEVKEVEDVKEEEEVVEEEFVEEEREELFEIERREDTNWDDLFINGGFGYRSDNSGISLLSLEDWNTPELKEYIYECLLNHEESIDFTPFSIPYDDYRDVFTLCNGMLDDYGDLYFVSRFGFIYGTYLEDDSVIVDHLEVIYKQGFDEAAFNREVKKALSEVDSSMSNLEKAIVLHDYLAIHVAYDYENYLNGTMDSSVYNAYGTLVNGRAVCQGYAETYKYLCNQVGIECLMVSSSSMHHAWNLIKIDGKYYHVDVTWDDPVWDYYGLARHKNLLRSDAGITEAGHSNWSVLSEGKTVDISAQSSTYDGYYWKDITSPMIKKDGNWYYIYNNVLDICLMKSDSIYTLGTTSLAYIGEWTVVGNPYSYWQGAFSGLFCAGSKLYFNNKANIYSYDLETGTKDIVYNVDSSNGNIYGIGLEKNDIYAAYRINPSADVNTYLPQNTGITIGSCVWDEGVVTKDPTCTENGIKTYTCRICGDTKTEEIPMISHEWQESIKNPTCTEKGLKTNTCRMCGETKSEEIPMISHEWIKDTNDVMTCKYCKQEINVFEQDGRKDEILGYSLSLSKEISFNCYMSLTDSTLMDSSSYVLFTMPNGLSNKEFVQDAIETEGKYVFRCTVSAKDMTGEISMQLVTSKGKGKTYAYSVNEYANYLIDHQNQYTTKSVEIAKAMLTYGKYAQEYFGYNTENVPTNINTLKNNDFSSYAYQLSDQNDSIDFIGARLILTSKPGLKLYFTGNITSNEYTVSKEGKYTVLTISNIDDMTKMYEINDNNFSLKYSIFSYGKQAMNTSNTSLKNLMNAMYEYNKVMYQS